MKICLQQQKNKDEVISVINNSLFASQSYNFHVPLNNKLYSIKF